MDLGSGVEVLRAVTMEEKDADFASSLCLWECTVGSRGPGGSQSFRDGWHFTRGSRQRPGSHQHLGGPPREVEKAEPEVTFEEKHHSRRWSGQQWTVSKEVGALGRPSGPLPLKPQGKT